MASFADRITAPSSAAKPPTVSAAANDMSIDKAAEGGKDERGDQIDGAGQGNEGSAIEEPEFDVEVKLHDINSPLFSIKSFKELGLSEPILDGIYQMRFIKPSKIQEKALPLLMANPPQNMIGQSQSGTGKTAAFVLNILSRLDLSPAGINSPQAIVLAPTRELARQIIGVIQVMGTFMKGLRISASIPTDQANRNQRLDGQIIVGTAGTTMDLVRKRLLDTKNIRILVLDEADNMLDQQGMGEQCMRVKSMLARETQIVLFSATFPEKVVKYAQMFSPNANQITLRHEELTVEGIRQLYVDCASEEEKYDILVKLYGLMTVGQSIIFVKRRDTAVEIQNRMVGQGHKVASLTGALEGTQRDVIIDSFRNGSAKVLLATNVLARGIDVQTVSMVINYDIPDDGRGNPDAQTYLHRIGRTGRFGRIGVSISFIHDQQSFKSLQWIADYYKIRLLKIDTSDWDSVEETIKSVIKSAAAQPDYQPHARDQRDHPM